MRPRSLLFLFLLLTGCRTVVTTTTEVRPSRYAVVEFTRRVAPDSVVAYAVSAVRAENLKVQKADRAAGTVVAGPVKVVAENGMPELEALVTISSALSGPETTIRITASATLEPNQTGGTDPRLMAIVQRIEQRLNALIAH